MTAVFLSGSRRLTRLNEELRTRIERMLEQGFELFVGDANGADKAIQSYLASRNYRNVRVFHSGNFLRNNIGSWPSCSVSVNNNMKGRDFYTVKDKEMAKRADYGFVVWNGESIGSINNVVELLSNDKPAVIYVSPLKTFFTLKNFADFEHFIHQLPSTAFLTAKKSLREKRQSRMIDGQWILPL